MYKFETVTVNAGLFRDAYEKAASLRSGHIHLWLILVQILMCHHTFYI